MNNYNYPASVNSVSDALQDLYARFISFLPDFLAAIIVLVVGWIVAVAVAKLIKSLLHSAKIDELGDKLGLDQLSARSGMKLSVSGTIAWVVKWFLLIAFFLGATDILELPRVSDFLNDVLHYLPNVVAAAAILLVGAMVANFLSRLVRHSVQAAGLASADMLAAVTQWAIMIFAVLATLNQLGIADAFMRDLFRAVVYMLALAGGLAFGLGGKDHASKVLDKIEKDMKS